LISANDVIGVLLLGHRALQQMCQSDRRPLRETQMTPS
jgi:hypothetical protein